MQNLDSTRLEIESLRQAGTELEQELARLEARITEAPRIEQEYRALTRDYDNAMVKYKEVRDKEMQAQLAEALESDRKSERFSLIEPPLVPEKPDKPNRPAILFLGVVLAGAGGIGNLALREMLDKSVRGARAVLALTGAPPLASIPFIETRADRRRRAMRIWLWILGVLIALAAGAAAVHFFWKPLDVIWFTLLRRIEILLPLLTSPET